MKFFSIHSKRVYVVVTKLYMSIMVSITIIIIAFYNILFKCKRKLAVKANFAIKFGKVDL